MQFYSFINKTWSTYRLHIQPRGLSSLDCRIVILRRANALSLVDCIGGRPFETKIVGAVHIMMADELKNEVFDSSLVFDSTAHDDCISK